MNSMTQAFTQAVAKTAAINGVPVKMPAQTEIIWRWIKDHPNCTTSEVARATRIADSKVSAVVWAMFTERGMLTRRRGSRMSKGVWEYTAVGKEYELLPKKTSRVAAKKAQHDDAGTTALVNDEAAALDKMLDIPPAPPKFDIEVYTLGELRAIHAQLKALFG